MAFLINLLILIPILLIGLDIQGTETSAKIAGTVARVFGRQTSTELPTQMSDNEGRQTNDSQNGFPEIVFNSVSERISDNNCEFPFSHPRTSFIQRSTASKRETKVASVVNKGQSTTFNRFVHFLVNFIISVGGKLKETKERVERLDRTDFTVKEVKETVSRGSVAPVSRPERRKRNPFGHFPSLISPAIPERVQLLLAKKLIAIDRRIKTQRQTAMPRIVFELPGQEELSLA